MCDERWCPAPRLRIVCRCQSLHLCNCLPKQLPMLSVTSSTSSGGKATSSNLSRYIQIHSLSCTPLQLSLFLQDYGCDYELDNNGLLCRDGYPLPVNLMVWVNECSFCTHTFLSPSKHEFSVRVWNELQPQVDVLSNQFSDLASKNCHTWEGFKKRGEQLKRRIHRKHLATDHSSACCSSGSSVEWAEKSSTAYVPPGARSAPPFLLCATWGRYVALLRQMGMQHVADWLTTTCRSTDCLKETTEFLKLLSVYAKASAPDVLEASWLVDLHRARGHVDPLSGDDLVAAAEHWLCSPHEHTPSVSFYWSCLCYVKGLDWLQSTFGARSQLNIEEYEHNFWEARPWGTSGASDRYDVKIGVQDGRVVKAPKTKNMLALYTTRSQLEAKVFCPRREIIMVGPKTDEFGKARHILRGDDATYLRHSYLDDILYSKLTPGEESRRSPVTCSPNDWRHSLRYAGRGVDDRKLNILFDHSGFDEHQSIVLVRGFLLAVIEMAARHLPLSVRRMADTAHASAILPALVGCPSKPHIGDHLGGLPSGWRWTALLDTVLNYSLTMTAWDVVLPGAVPRAALFMGDDSLVQVDRCHFGSSTRVAALINSLGYELSTLKNYASTVTADFLGYTLLGERNITGAPSRIAISIISRHNVPNSQQSKLDLAFTRVWTWMLFSKRATRIGGPPPTWAMLTRDIDRATGLSATSVVSVMQTPRHLGGLGMNGITPLFSDAPPITFAEPIIRERERTDDRPLNPVIPPSLSDLEHRGLVAILDEFYGDMGVIKTSYDRSTAAISFTPARSKPLRRYNFFPGGKHYSMPPCRWVRVLPEAISTSVKLYFSRKRRDFERDGFCWLDEASRANYKWLLNRGHSWAVVRRWICNRPLVAKRFSTLQDELELTTPVSSTPEQALAFLTGTGLNTATWQELLDRVRLGKRDLLDGRGSFARYFVKKDEWIGDALKLRV
ncbi:polymerase [Schistocephalus solidus toti-like virus 1]|nr:polymerase [Schistocephalus solidus toti-like virus 1]